MVVAGGLETERAVRASSMERVLLDWRGAQARVHDYLTALDLEAPEVERLERKALERALGEDSHRGAISDAMDETVRVVLETHPLAALDPEAIEESRFWRWRLAAWQARGIPQGEAFDWTSLAPTPPLLRGFMTPERYLGRRLGEWGRRRRTPDPRSEAADRAREERRLARSPWEGRGRWRRALLGFLVLVPSVMAGASFLATLPAQVWLPAEVALAVFFGSLFGLLSLGFWTAVFGFMVLLRGGDRFAITRGEGASSQPLHRDFRTAVVMPICDEPVTRVFAGLRAIRESLVRAGAVDGFDFFVLSDSGDPDLWVDEEAAWADWRRTAPGAGGIFYRRRRVRQKRKSGNLADFCRRFGRRYRYMIVLDADSVMSGESLVRLVRLMEAHPHVGIIQSAPMVVRARSLFGRIQQFANRLYGPMFAAGMHYWQLGDSPYWGHNAILRVEPFMKHCGLPRLWGHPPLGGDILSHDFVEAALLGRAGWSIWLAFDLPGSYEEAPASLLEEMQRDQRWCQGNLQHLRLLFTEGLASVHRALFLNGIFSYVSAVLWLGFLAAGTAEAVMWALRGPDYFSTGLSLFPTWPIWRPERAVALFGAVFAVLVMPKFLAMLLALVRREASAFGGMARLLGGVVLETLSTALFAPIRMAFYCRFVLLNLLGRAVTWKGGADELQETSWREATRRHGPDTLIACLWALSIHWLHPAAFWWLAPVAGALALSVPLSVLASRVSLGALARSAGCFLTPEEKSAPREIQELEAELEAEPAAWSSHGRGFPGAVVDPLLNAYHSGLLRGPRSLAPRIRKERSELVDRALAIGPNLLDNPEKRLLLSDAVALLDLHTRVWRLEEREAAQRWGLASGISDAVDRRSRSLSR